MKTNSFPIWFPALTAFLGISEAHYGQAQPANDSFSNRTVIVGTNITVTGSNTGATREAGEPYHAGFQGGHSVWWSWTPPISGVVTISTAGSSFDTLLGIYLGSSVQYLEEVASNDDDGSLRTSRASFHAEAGGGYQIVVDGYGVAAGSITLKVQLGPVQPAPFWELPDPYGAIFRSSDYAGSVILYNFWGTTCPPCLAEMPDMVDLQEKYRADGFVILGADVSWWNDTPWDVLEFLATFSPPINYQVLMSTAANEAAWGGISAIPATFIIDRQNRVRMKYVGSQTGSTFERQILPLLYCDLRLNSRCSGNEMALSWPTTVASFRLESSSSLSNPSWMLWPDQGSPEDGSNTVHVTTSGTPRFFRLKLAP